MSVTKVQLVSNIVGNVSGGASFTGIVTATGLSVGGQLVSTLGVGIATEGGNVGTGATVLDFRGAGISTVTVASGIATINITGGGGGGVSTTGILSCRGIANSAIISESISFDDSFAEGTNYAMVGPITVTGSGTTVTVGAGVSYVIV